MTRPVFLLSLPRAGSTLLQRLLLMSGKCATLGEPSLLLRFLGEGPAMTRKATYWESLVETAAADMRRAWPGYDAAYRAGVRDLMLGIYDGLADGKEWFLDKTPRYTLIAEEILATFPDAKFTMFGFLRISLSQYRYMINPRDSANSVFILSFCCISFALS